MRFPRLLGALCAAASFAHAAIPPSEQVVAVEFYHAGFDHYFITANPPEIADLDTGVHAGWARTGYQFAVVKQDSTYPGTSPVCRFYSESLRSHFYSSKPSECDDVKVRFPATWLFEAPEVFRAFPVDPNTGLCPADTTPVYRLYNNRADANHRYTDQPGVFVFMKAKGYIPEGDGNPALPVAFCTPAGGSVVPPPLAGAPQCTVSASNAAPMPGASVTLAANCTNAPVGFLWTGCSSTGNTCVASRATAGTSTFTVYAANAQGQAAPASLAVTWSSNPGVVPACTITASNTLPLAGTTITLSANCSQSPTSYVWQECNYVMPSNCDPLSCAATSTTCNVTSAFATYRRYNVAGVNGAGTGPGAEVQVEWRNPGSEYTGGFCGQYSRAKLINVAWGDPTRYQTRDYGGWPPDLIYVLAVAVPSSPASYAQGGYTSVFEYNAEPALRHVTVSTVPCDFRGADPSGVNGPVAQATGVQASIIWNAGPGALAPGTTYYFNFRNVSCGQATCDAMVEIFWPR